MPQRPPVPAADRTPQAQLTEGPMHGIVGYQLAQAAIVTDHVFDERVGHSGALRRVEYTMLALVQANPDVTARQLARALSVTPPRDWNQLGIKPGKFAETWTLDGEQLNDVTFYAGVEPGEPLLNHECQQLLVDHPIDRHPHGLRVHHETIQSGRHGRAHAAPRRDQQVALGRRQTEHVMLAAAHHRLVPRDHQLEVGEPPLDRGDDRPRRRLPLPAQFGEPGFG